MTTILSIGYWFMVFNATFNNISIILWRSFNWWRKPEYTEKTTDLSSTPCHEQGLELTTLVVIDTDCTGSCKSNYHTLTTMTAPKI